MFIKTGYIIFGLVLSLLFLVAAVILTFFLFPVLVENGIKDSVALEGGTPQFERFVKLPFAVDYKVFFFNVENYEEVLAGAKPIVKEIGPFVYKETKSKTIISTDTQEDTVSYRQDLKFEFDPEASGNYSDEDFITIPNVLVNGVVQLVDSMGQTKLIGNCLDAIFPGLYSPFIRVKAKDAIFDGLAFCPHKIFTCFLQKTVVCQQAKELVNIDTMADGALKFSFLNFKARSDNGLFTIKRGVEDVRTLGNTVEWNNMSQTSFWGDNSTCDHVKGTDGGIYAPQIGKDTILQVYSTDICRSLELEFMEETTYKEYPAFKFSASNNTLRSREQDPDDDCYCLKKSKDIDGQDSCFLDGVLDLYTCYNAPVLFSRPHFLWADPNYLKGVQGLTPDPEKHDSFMIIEPNTGSPLQEAMRWQINSVIRPVQVEGMERLPRVMMPVLWTEESFSLPDDLIEELNETYFKKIWLLNIIQWTILGIGIVLTVFFAICLACSKCRKTPTLVLSNGNKK